CGHGGPGGVDFGARHDAQALAYVQPIRGEVVGAHDGGHVAVVTHGDAPEGVVGGDHHFHWRGAAHVHVAGGVTAGDDQSVADAQRGVAVDAVSGGYVVDARLVAP